MADGILPGLVKGLATTARSLTRHTHTAEYPDVSPALPPRSRGVIALTEENCTSCMLCARECPDWCIYIDSHKEELPPTTPGGRARQRNVLDRFAIDFSLCMYCGICIEVCPFDALHWSPEFEYAELDIRDLIHEKDRLGAWMATVPPPAALDPGSPDPAEVAAAAKPARGPGAGPAGARGAGAAARPARVRAERTAERTDERTSQRTAERAVERGAEQGVERTAVMPTAQPPAPRSPAAQPPGTVPPASDVEQTTVLPVSDASEAADTVAAQGDSTQVLPTVSSQEPTRSADEPGASDEEGRA
ncbi:NADH-quinone oxidoreductase subunit I [Terrabacter sp. MAHUQ-38]|uniref:NuoI/complex I 23 kDa subunit family protein n=1 Tax=unclassified Terrabacter TaxID=2630222 RepID=UPI00165DF4D8|nr:NADH-quinone oxidoreductase subunit I [Terrabacter sp. MAHUQ-38]MBC9822234.1 4Fe-4S binding protein [Terrabacter sp. MAHUQ-38]